MVARFGDDSRDVRDHTVSLLGQETPHFSLDVYNSLMRTLGFSMSDYLCRLNCLKIIKK